MCMCRHALDPWITYINQLLCTRSTSTYTEFSAVSDIIWNPAHYNFSDLCSEQTESVPCVCDDKHLSG